MNNGDQKTGLGSINGAGCRNIYILPHKAAHKIVDSLGKGPQVKLKLKTKPQLVGYSYCTYSGKVN